MADNGGHGEGDRVRALSDRAEIGDVIHRYVDAVRREDIEGIVGCFTEDAELDYGHVQMAGSEPIRAYFARISSSSPQGAPAGSSALLDEKVASTPMVTNILIDLAGDEAHCESMCLAVHAGRRAGGTTVLVRGTRNVDDLVRGAEGWRIRRRAHLVLWSFETPATAGPATRSTP